MIRVGVIDDHPVFRNGLAIAVEGDDDLDLVATFESIEDFDARPPVAIDVIVLDLGLPGRSGADAVTHLRDRKIVVLVVSAQGRKHDVVDAIAAGSAGYLTKSSEPEEILQAIHTVASGGTYVSPALAAFLLEENRSNGRERQQLSPREREVLGLLASGEKDRDIAAQLFISPNTVGSHLDRIREKTGQRRRAALTRLAIDEGIVDPNDGSAGVAS